MTIPKLSSRERAHLGLTGEVGTDYRLRFDVVEVIAAGAFLEDNPEQKIDVAQPGDLVVIWSQAQFAPDKTIAIAEAHPDLLKAGFCSFPRVLTEDHAGPVSMLFRCEREIDLTVLPYMITVVSLGTCKQ